MQQLRNIAYSSVLSFEQLVGYQTGQVVSKTLVQNESISMTLFAFDKDEQISAHSSRGDALVIALDGTGEIAIGDDRYTLQAGDAIVMPAQITHAVFAADRFKMFLAVVFPQ